MKAEVTLNARNTFASANLHGGFAPRLDAIAPAPVSGDASLTYPLQRDCNTQGQVSSLYYAYSKDLKNSGSRHAIAINEGFPLGDQAVL